MSTFEHEGIAALSQHTCFGRVFCGVDKQTARAECPVCTPEPDAETRARILAERVELDHPACDEHGVFDCSNPICAWWQS